MEKKKGLVPFSKLLNQQELLKKTDTVRIIQKQLCDINNLNLFFIAVI